ncbi:MAG: hypothetical protein CMO55_17790 [Verrucomicrobiales bacterium]|nr:hypothetical protein [Verrucomicrobiales bacterium]
MRSLIAILTLAIWGTCSLHCSVEAREMWPDSLHHSSSCPSSSSCPTDHSPDGESESQCQDALYTLSENLVAVDAPALIDFDADSFFSLVRLLNEALNRDASSPGDPTSRLEADLFHKLRDQSSGRLAAPIRGPSV